MEIEPDQQAGSKIRYSKDMSIEEEKGVQTNIVDAAVWLPAPLELPLRSTSNGALL